MRESIGKIEPTRLDPTIEELNEEISRLPGVEAIGGHLVKMLDEDVFRYDHFDEVLSDWNKKTNTTGPSLELDEVRCKHGKLKKYYFPESNTVKFGFELK